MCLSLGWVFTYFAAMTFLKQRREFLAQVDDLAPFLQLMDLIPDVGFFMKDRRGRFILQNRRAYECCRVGSEIETLGKTDRDFFPKDRADLYMEGDQEVMRTGAPIINAIQPSPDAPNGEELIIYSKVPVRDRQGEIIGVAGIHRRIDNLRAPPKAFGRISRAVEILHQRFREPLDMADLAASTGLSRSQFDRHFQRLFGTTPHEYLLRIRVHHASDLLERTTTSITNIALETGFYDHSHFSRTYKRIMGVSPLGFRKRHQMA